MSTLLLLFSFAIFVMQSFPYIRDVLVLFFMIRTLKNEMFGNNANKACPYIKTSEKISHFDFVGLVLKDINFIFMFREQVSLFIFCAFCDS